MHLCHSKTPLGDITLAHLNSGQKSLSAREDLELSVPTNMFSTTRTLEQDISPVIQAGHWS